MLAAIQAFEVDEAVVGRVAIPMVDMAAIRYIAERRPPNIAVKLLAAARKVSLAWPKPVKTAIEILRERVKHDRIDEPACRLSADFHPSPVKNK